MGELSVLPYRVYRHSRGSIAIAKTLLQRQSLAERHEHIVLVRPTFTGICSADIREMRGERPGRNDFGHEVVGTVVHSTHDRYAPGDRVVLNPFQPVERESAFAETMYVAGSARALDGALFKVPADRMEFSAAEPLACVIHAARQSRCENAGTRLVLGAGFFGYLLYRYLEARSVSVALGNRTRDRLDHLVGAIGDLCVVHDLDSCPDTFASVFLTQATISRRDIDAATRLLRPDGEIVLFGAIDPDEDEPLYLARKNQERIECSQDGKRYFLQGTLDATSRDLRDAIKMLALPDFSRSIAAIFAPPLTFEQGADHLRKRANAPRSYQKYVVRMSSDEP